MALQLNERIDRFESPFRRLDALIADIVPDPAFKPILMHVGEPQHGTLHGAREDSRFRFETDRDWAAHARPGPVGGPRSRVG